LSLATTASIDFAEHNITPPLGKQLVLKLKGGEFGAEILERFPCCVRWQKTCPLDEHMPDPATQLCMQGLIRVEQATSLVKRRQSWRCRRWRTSERLQHPDVEYVVNPGSGWQ